MKPQAPITIFWFRRDLRLVDNCGLFHALSLAENVLPVFIFDKQILDKLNTKYDRRVHFIHSALEDLNKEIEEEHSSLLILHNTPLEAFKKLISTYTIKQVYTNHDYEPYAITRDKQIEDYLKSKGITFRSFKDQVIFEKSEVVKADGNPYTIFTPYSRIWKSKLTEESTNPFPVENVKHNFLKTNPFRQIALNEIGFEKTDQHYNKAEINEKAILKYHEVRNIPSLDATTHLSVHLRFGTVSVRKLAAVGHKFNEQWLNELIWREFFMMILFHFPYVINTSFKKKYEAIEWRNNEAEFDAWCKGETGYPIVDAGMRELNETGFMHNRVRMITASFLTKHLLIDWRWGEAYFAEKLLDYELASNNGNWQWAAGCGSDSAPYFRIFNPTAQMKKFDPKLEYIKKWIKDFKPGYISPLVDHDFARNRVLTVFKKSLGNII